jgi:hypothetical protein
MSNLIAQAAPWGLVVACLALLAATVVCYCLLIASRAEERAMRAHLTRTDPDAPIPYKLAEPSPTGPRMEPQRPRLAPEEPGERMPTNITYLDPEARPWATPRS